MYEFQRNNVLDGFQRHLKLEHGLSKKTIDQHATMAGVFLDRVEEIHPDQSQAKAFQEDLMDADYSTSHINNTMKALEYYYEFHGDEFEFTRLNRPKRRPETLSDQQVRRILYACDTYRDYAIVKTLVSSGLRASEVCDMDVVDVDLDERRLIVRAGKFDKDGVARISQSCAEAVAAYLKRRECEADPLFLSRTDERLTRSGLLSIVKRRARDAGIGQAVTVHQFRHYFATSMIENGADISVVKELLRHEDIASTMTYLHMSDAALTEQYDRYVSDI